MGWLNGLTTTFSTCGNLNSKLLIEIIGVNGNKTIVWDDAFFSFKSTLEKFCSIVRTGDGLVEDEHHRKVVSVLNEGVMFGSIFLSLVAPAFRPSNCRILSEKQHSVTFTTTSTESGEALLKKLNKHGNVDFVTANINTAASIEELIKKLETKKFTYLINNARDPKGLAISSVTASEMDAFQTEFLMAVILPYKLSVAFSEQLCSIVNISSMYGVVPPNAMLYSDGYDKSPIQYGIAKAAQIHLTKELEGQACFVM